MYVEDLKHEVTTDYVKDLHEQFSHMNYYDVLSFINSNDDVIVMLNQPLYRIMLMFNDGQTAVFFYDDKTIKVEHVINESSNDCLIYNFDGKILIVNEIRNNKYDWQTQANKND